VIPLKYLHLVMGKIIECRCANCQYSESAILLGFGKISGFFFPCFDPQTKTVKHIEVDSCFEIKNNSRVELKQDKIERLIGEGYVPYFLRKMYKKKFFGTKAISPSPLYLQNKFNACPKCENFTLTFWDNGGLFD
jgi:hypothetical protein